METNELAIASKPFEADSIIVDAPKDKPIDKPWLFKPGNTIGHGGRPKHDISAQICRAIVEKHGQALENALVRMCKKDVKAIKFVFERAYGKLPQPVEHAGQGGGPIEIIFGVDAPAWCRRGNGEE